MFIPARNTWHPLGRAPRKQAPPPEPLDQDEPPPDADVLPESDAWDEADELAAMSDTDFCRSLRQAIAGVQEGSVPSMIDATRPPLKDRPWGHRHKRRDRHGKAF